MITAQQVSAISDLIDGRAGAVLSMADAELAAGQLNQADQFGITGQAFVYMLTNTMFETKGLTAMVENLYYTHADRIAAVWPNRFHYNGVGKGPLDASLYVNNPQLLGNTVYALRNGNGNVASGDGFRFRGRGGPHLTFRDHYAAASHDLFGDTRLVDNPDMAAAHDHAMTIMYWFWNSRKLTTPALAGDFTYVVTQINGSSATVPQRKQLLNQVTSILGA